MGIYFAARLLELQGTADEGEFCPCLTYALSRELADAQSRAQEIRQQLEEVLGYTGKLRWLEKRIVQGPRVQRHCLGNAWSEEEQTSLDAILETLDIGPTHNFWTKGRKCVPAVKDGIVYNSGANAYVLPNLAHLWGNAGNVLGAALLGGGIVSVAMGSFATAVGLTAAFADTSGTADLTQIEVYNTGLSAFGVTFLGEFAFLGGLITAGGYLTRIAKNPFSSLADEMEKRVAYVREHPLEGV